MLVAGRLGGTRTRSEPPPVGRAAPCQVPGRVTRSPDAARRTARAPPIDRRSAPERRPGACRPGSGVTPLERPAAPLPARFHDPAAPLSASRRGDQRSTACSRCLSTAVQRPSALCRCPLRAALASMCASWQPGSRSATRHQPRSAPRCTFADRSGGPAATHQPARGAAQGPPATPRPPPLSSPTPAARGGTHRYPRPCVLDFQKKGGQQRAHPGVDAAVADRGGDRVPGARQASTPWRGYAGLSQRLRQAAPADDEERDRNGAPAAAERPG